MTHTHTHTHTHGKTPLGEGSTDAENSTSKHTTFKTNSHIPTGFEPAVPTSQRPQIYILDFVANVTGVRLSLSSKNIQ